MYGTCKALWSSPASAKGSGYADTTEPPSTFLNQFESSLIDKVATLATMATVNTFTAKEAKNNFGRLLDEARYAPVGIQRNGRLVVVVISAEKYNELMAESGAYAGKRAKRAGQKNITGTAKNREHQSRKIMTAS
jgi:prevent-host-death family protein